MFFHPFQVLLHHLLLVSSIVKADDLVFSLWIIICSLFSEDLGPRFQVAHFFFYRCSRRIYWKLRIVIQFLMRIARYFGINISFVAVLNSILPRLIFLLFLLGSHIFISSWIVGLLGTAVRMVFYKFEQVSLAQTLTYLALSFNKAYFMANLCDRVLMLII